jgi:hypothetical protein
MVNTRRENGSYVHTEEWKKNLSETFQKQVREGTFVVRGPLTEKGRASMIAAISGPQPNHWTKTDEGKQRVSQIHKGKNVPLEARRNMSRAQRKFRDDHPERVYTRGDGGFREDLGHYVRSNWEANFARILIFQRKEYEYEKYSFELENGQSYTPDFLVDGIFVEVKGFLTEQSRSKIEMFRKEYPNIEFMIIDEEEYLKLKQGYVDKILWEGR